MMIVSKHVRYVTVQETQTRRKQMINAGTYKAKVQDYGIKRTKAGEPAPTIAFACMTEGGSVERVFWQGSFKQGTARDIALKALMLCGLDDPSKLANLALGKDGGALRLDKEVSVEVIHEPSPSTGKVYARVQWVNSLDASFKDMMSRKDFIVAMASGMGLEADFINLASAQGVKPAPAPVASDDDLVSIPF
jgi:hypothetical protein